MSTPMSYGPSLNLTQAQAVMNAALACAKEHQWPMVIAVVDTAGWLLAFQRMDNAQYGSVDVAQGKARTAVLFKRPTKAFDALIEQGGRGVRTVTMPNMVALEGGIPLVVNGQVVGGLGISGMTSEQDQVVAEAGAAALAALVG